MFHSVSPAPCCPTIPSPRAWGVAVTKRQGMKRGTFAVARKLAVIMHRIWVTGDEFDFGGPAVAAKAA